MDGLLPLSVDHDLVGADTADLPILGLCDCGSDTGIILLSVHGLLFHCLYFHFSSYLRQHDCV